VINITYIYLITGIDNSPFSAYIGKTKNPTSREYSHRLKYGYNIDFTVIDSIDSLSSKDWKTLECYWIEQFKQWGFTLVNKNNGGGGSEFRPKEIIEQTTPKLYKPIIQYDLNCIVIREWPSIKEAVNVTGITNIPNCVQGKNKKAGGYIWKYKDDTDFSYNISPFMSRSEKHLNKLRKPKPQGFGKTVSKSLLSFYRK
jgi:hypothetical protein